MRIVLYVVAALLGGLNGATLGHVFGCWWVLPVSFLTGLFIGGGANWFIELIEGQE